MKAKPTETNTNCRITRMPFNIFEEKKRHVSCRYVEFCKLPTVNKLCKKYTYHKVNQKSKKIKKDKLKKQRVTFPNATYMVACEEKLQHGIRRNKQTTNIMQ